MQQLPKRPQITISIFNHMHLSHNTTHNAQCSLTKTHCTKIHSLHTFNHTKVNPNVTISNSRHNLIGHNYQNSHNKKVHLISYPTLRTATKTDLRFEIYEFLKFWKNNIFLNFTQVTGY